MSVPQVIRVVNAAWQLGGDRGLLASVADGADVLLLVECRDRHNDAVDVGKLLESLDHRVGDWWVWQNTTTGALAGSAVAVRKGSGLVPAGRQRVADRARRSTRSFARVSRLDRMSARGRNVQPRYLRSVRLRDTRPGRRRTILVAAAHLPLRSTGKQDDALRWLARRWRLWSAVARLFAGDGNMPWTRIRHELGAPHGSGADVMFATWSAGWGVFRTSTYQPAGTDHHVLTLAETTAPARKARR